MNYKLIIATIFLALFAMGNVVNAQVVVIVNKDNETTNLSKDELKSIYLGEQQQWQDGSRIVLTDRKDNDEAAIKFYEDFLGRSQRKLRKLWLRKVITGEISPPESYETDEGIIKFVSKNTGAIGFIKLESLNDSVRTISIEGREPKHKDYELK